MCDIIKKEQSCSSCRNIYHAITTIIESQNVRGWKGPLWVI